MISTPVVEEVVENIVEEPIVEETQDLVFEMPTETSVVENVVETPVVSSPTLEENFNVNSILDATIAQLVARKNVIADSKSQKSSSVSDLLSQIEALQSQVELLNGEIAELDIENKKIDKNISSIEKMKLDSSEVAELPERQRKHAPEKIKAKK